MISFEYFRRASLSEGKLLFCFFRINNYTPKLGKELTHEAIDDAFAVWARHSPLKFRKVSIYDNPDIITFFAEGFHNDNTPFDGPGGFLAHAYYPGLGIGGDTHFDGAEEWTLHKEPYQGGTIIYCTRILPNLKYNIWIKLHSIS